MPVRWLNVSYILVLLHTTCVLQYSGIHSTKCDSCTYSVPNLLLLLLFDVVVGVIRFHLPDFAFLKQFVPQTKLLLFLLLFITWPENDHHTVALLGYISSSFFFSWSKHCVKTIRAKEAERCNEKEYRRNICRYSVCVCVAIRFFILLYIGLWSIGLCKISSGIY